jgi:predicted metal-dependent hydrolase
MRTIDIDGEQVTVNIKPSESRRAVYVEFKPGEITIEVPHGTKLDPEAFLPQHIQKITKGYREAKAKINVLQEDGILIHGHRHKIIIEDAQNPPSPTITLTTTTITIHTKPLEDPDILLKNWITDETKRLAEETISKHALEAKPQALRVSDTPRWGQCNKRGEIILNWQLATLPPELAEYITIHEAIHLKHFNHQTGFHTDLEKILPNHHALEKRINNYIAIPPNHQYTRKNPPHDVTPHNTPP